MTRRRLIGLGVIVAVLVVVAGDGWLVHHFGKNAATGQYPDDYLNAVACPSEAQCWAVGQTGSAPGGNTLSEARGPLLTHETGGRWRTLIAARPVAKGSALEAISCPGTTDCWAVGGNSAGGSAIIEHWSGGAWRLAPSPVVHDGELHAVSCASPGACWATGGTQSYSGASGDLLEQWNGAQWRIVRAVAGGLRPQQFSCPVPGFCTVLGTRSGAAAAATYSGGRWTAAAPPPAPPGAGPLPSLFGCTGPAMCLAAFPGGTSLVTDAWNGRDWTPVPTAKLAFPISLTCAAARGCYVLGMTRSSHPLALRWRGNNWVPAAMPAAQGIGVGYLTGVACGNRCWAVGGKGGSRRNGAPYTSPLVQVIQPAA